MARQIQHLDGDLDNKGQPKQFQKYNSRPSTSIRRFLLKAPQTKLCLLNAKFEENLNFCLFGDWRLVIFPRNMSSEICSTSLSTGN